jgi:hypothetical protein
MSEIKNGKNQNIYCPECGTLLSLQDILNGRNIALEYFHCSYCGTKINLDDYNFEIIQKSEEVDPPDTINSEEISESEEVSDIEFDYDELQQALTILTENMDFPLNFNKGLHHLTTRACYIIMKDVEQKEKIPLTQIKVTSDLIEYIEQQLEPLSTRKPEKFIFKNLDKLSYQEFLTYLKNFQKKLHRKKKYKNAFSVYIKWVIKLVFKDEFLWFSS